MTAEIAVLAIHGVGSQEPDYAEEMFDELQDRLTGMDKDAEKVAWGSVYWADVLEKRQLAYFNAAKRRGDLDFLRLRKFLLTAFGDASAYQKVESDANTTYEQIHQKVQDEVTSIYRNQLDAKPRPLIILAHSLGGHIISNFIWDHQKAATRDTNLSPFERMEKVCGIVTFGSNIPLFTFAYETVQPITFPPKNLPAHLVKKAKWLNFYDPDDVLGYPLKAINAAYAKVVSKDIAINAGGLLTSWNPLSHTQYWLDNDFTKPVAKLIGRFI